MTPQERMEQLVDALDQGFTEFRRQFADIMNRAAEHLGQNFEPTTRNDFAMAPEEPATIAEARKLSDSIMEDARRHAEEARKEAMHLHQEADHLEYVAVLWDRIAYGANAPMPAEPSR